MNITIFGGSQTRPGEPAYEEALKLGRLLGAAGHSVLTGGYIGTMEAVSRGAAEAGGRVIGVTCAEIERWRPVKANAWVQEEQRFETLHERLFALIDQCQAAIALPGGVGTLTELALTWNLLLTAAIPPRPLILVGDAWRRVVETFLAEMGSYIPETQRVWAQFAPNVEAVGKIIPLA